MLAMMSSFHEVFIDQLKAKVHRGQSDTFKQGGIIQHPGFGYRLVDELADAVKARLNLGSMRFGKNAADLRRAGKDPGRRVDVYPTVLVCPVCGGCGKPVALSRSTGKYKSFVCLNSIHGGHVRVGGAEVLVHEQEPAVGILEIGAGNDGMRRRGGFCRGRIFHLRTTTPKGKLDFPFL